MPASSRRARCTASCTGPCRRRARTFIEAALRRHEELKPTAQALKGGHAHAAPSGPITQRLATGSRHAHLTATLSSEQSLDRPWYQSMPLVSVLGAIAVAVVALALGLTLRDTVGRSATPRGPAPQAVAPGRTAVRGLLRPLEPRAAALPIRHAGAVVAAPVARNRPAAPVAAPLAAASADATPGSTAAAPVTDATAGEPLRKIHGAKPEYPEAAGGVEGWVDVHFTVSTEGVPENISVTLADPREVFDAAAIAAVAQWRYAPRQAPGEADNRIHFKPPETALAVTPDPPTR